jgi:hypothetical protein
MSLLNRFSNKKSGLDEFIDEEMSRNFPGGEPEREFKSRAIVTLSNGKLDPREALIIYGSVKRRIRFLYQNFDGETCLGPDINKIIDEVKTSSKDRLSTIEAGRILSYIILEKLPTSDADVEQLFQWKKGLFGSNGVGTDSDVIELGIGEFGLDPTNPIPVRGIASSDIYLRRLRTLEGYGITFDRKESFEVAGMDGRVDPYEIYHDGSLICTLYIHPYNQRISKRAPKGFRVVTNYGRSDESSAHTSTGHRLLRNLDYLQSTNGLLAAPSVREVVIGKVFPDALIRQFSNPRLAPGVSELCAKRLVTLRSESILHSGQEQVSGKLSFIDRLIIVRDFKAEPLAALFLLVCLYIRDALTMRDFAGNLKKECEFGLTHEGWLGDGRFCSESYISAEQRFALLVACRTASSITTPGTGLKGYWREVKVHCKFRTEGLHSIDDVASWMSSRLSRDAGFGERPEFYRSFAVIENPFIA